MLNMARSVSDYVVDKVDLRLIASLQCDGRATAEHVGEVLGVSPRIVARRWGDPIDLAAAAVFLASDAAAYITGQTLIVDGGLTLT